MELNDQQRASARKLGKEFERGVCALYADGAQLGQQRAFDFKSATGVKLTCVWVMLPAEIAAVVTLGVPAQMASTGAVQ